MHSTGTEDRLAGLAPLLDAAGQSHLVRWCEQLDADADTLDVVRFEELLGQASKAGPVLAIDLYENALGMVRGPMFGEFSGLDTIRPTAMRLESLADFDDEVKQWVRTAYERAG